MEQISALLPKLKALAESATPDASAGAPILRDLQKAVLSLRLVLATPAQIAANSPDIAAKAAAARDVYETAAFFTSKAGDVNGFERVFTQLKPFYSETDFASLLPPSENRLPLTALYLLLLVSAQPSRFAEFHAELERLPPSALSHPHITYVFALERALTEGSYSRALALKSSLPLPAHGAAFFAVLQEAVREKIVECCESSYTTYSLKRLAHALNVASEADALPYAEKMGWTVTGGVITFPVRNDDDDIVDTSAGAGMGAEADAEAAREGAEAKMARAAADTAALLSMATRVERIV